MRPGACSTIRARSARRLSRCLCEDASPTRSSTSCSPLRAASLPAIRWSLRPHFGAMVSAEQMKTALRYIETARREGGDLRLGGKRTREDTGGFYVEPTVFDRRRRPSATLAREEVFGPVLGVHALRRRRRRNPRRQRHAVRPGRRPLDARRLARPSRRARDQAPASCGSTAGTAATSPCRSAASSSPASAATARCTRSTNTRTSKSVSITLYAEGERHEHLAPRSIPTAALIGGQWVTSGRTCFRCSIRRRATRSRACRTSAPRRRRRPSTRRKPLPGVVDQDRQGARADPDAAGSISSSPTPSPWLSS